MVSWEWEFNKNLVGFLASKEKFSTGDIPSIRINGKFNSGYFD